MQPSMFCHKVDNIVKEPARMHPPGTLELSTFLCKLQIFKGHTLPDKKAIVVYSSSALVVYCFTETKVNGSRINSIPEHQPGWDSIHHSTDPHGLAVCYNELKNVIDMVNIPDQTFSSHMELMSVLLSTEGFY